MSQKRPSFIHSCREKRWKDSKIRQKLWILATWFRAPFIKLSNISESLTTLRHWSWIGSAFLTFLRVSCSQNTKTKCNKHSSVIFWQKIAFFKTFFVSKHQTGKRHTDESCRVALPFWFLSWDLIGWWAISDAFQENWKFDQ